MHRLSKWVWWSGRDQFKREHASDFMSFTDWEIPHIGKIRLIHPHNFVKVSWTRDSVRSARCYHISSKLIAVPVVLLTVFGTFGVGLMTFPTKQCTRACHWGMELVRHNSDRETELMSSMRYSYIERARLEFMIIVQKYRCWNVRS